MKKITPEIIKSARGAKSSTELADILGVNGIKVSAADSERYFAQLNGSELSDDDLSAVAGGDFCVDDSYVTSERIGLFVKVKVVSGRCCRYCQSNIGYTVHQGLAPNSTSLNTVYYMKINCSNCRGEMIGRFKWSEIEILE